MILQFFGIFNQNKIDILSFFFETIWLRLDWFLGLMWLNLYGRQAVRCKLKKGLKLPFFVFLALFWAYIGQPDGHISWVTLMPFASINPTNPRTNLWNFGENCSAFWGGWKTQFFWIGHFEFFFASSPWK